MKYNIVAIAIIAALLFTSCSDYLSYERKGDPSSDSFWKTESDAISAADGLYSFMNEDGVVGRGFMHYYNCSDDIVTGRAQAGTDRMKNFIADYSRDVVNNWPEMYKLIKRCNDIIRFVPSMNISQKTKDAVLGQAYFFRGWAYLWLAPYYGDNGENGGIPIVTEKTPLENLDVPRPAKVSANYDFCIEDFKSAAKLLPYFDEMSSSQYGRPHKTACWAYIAKAALYNATYDPSYYGTVSSYCDSIIDSKKHELVSDYAELFTIKNNYSKEYIFSFVSGNVNGSILPGVLLENKGWGLYNGWGYFTPTLSLVNEYESGDKRLEATILQPGDEFTFLGTKRIYYSTTSYSGMMFKKYIEPFTYADAIGKTVNTNGDYPTTKLNIPLVRYAEVLLWKAEALIWTGKNGDKYINEVRKRAQLKDITNASKSDLKHERRCELAGEFSNRFLDLVRWGDAATECTKPLYGYSVTAKVVPVTSKSDLNIQTIQVWPARTFNPLINHVFPIPTKEIATSKNLRQNKGY
jgi:hypothetical protein